MDSEILRFVSDYAFPVLLGALIGYVTNDIAIKMLFHPRKPLYVGKFHVPFTPGAIPKNKSRIANYVATAVEERLFRKEDLSAMVSGYVANGSAGKAAMEAIMSSSSPVASLVPNGEDALGRLPGVVSSSVVKWLDAQDLKPMLEKIIGSAIGGMLSNPLVSMFLSGGALDSVYSAGDSAIKDYARGDGKEKIEALVSGKIAEYGSKSAPECLDALGIDADTVSGMVTKIVGMGLEKCLPSVMDGMDIHGTVKSRIEAMDASELEDLVMSVMKHELRYIVNLGALIGATIGVANIFI